MPSPRAARRRVAQRGGRARVRAPRTGSWASHPGPSPSKAKTAPWDRDRRGPSLPNALPGRQKPHREDGVGCPIAPRTPSPYFLSAIHAMHERE